MELIVVILLLVGFMTVITDLFVTAYHAQNNSIKRDNLLHRIDSALGSMRRDVWSARRMAYADGHLDLTINDKNQVRWETAEPHRLTRRQTGDTPETQSTQTWIDLPDVDNVNVHGPLVTVAFKENPNRESLTLVNEVLLGGAK
jgi:short subunit dehydrogenase-like uncharacterized protein